MSDPTPKTMPATDRKYTLAEAQLELARRECGRFGHDFEVVDNGVEPVRLVCGRSCGHSGWSVVPLRPAQVEQVATHG